MEWDELQIQRSSEQQKEQQKQQTNQHTVDKTEDDEEVVESVMTANAQRYETEEKEQPPEQTQSAIVSTANKQGRPTAVVLTPQAAAAASHDCDAIAAAISSLISQHHFNIPITRVAIKSKKKRRDARKAEYRVGTGPKLFVRLLHGHLIAKADDEWVDFAEAVQDRIRLEIAAGH